MREGKRKHEEKVRERGPIREHRRYKNITILRTDKRGESRIDYNYQKGGRGPERREQGHLDERRSRAESIVIADRNNSFGKLVFAAFVSQIELEISRVKRIRKFNMRRIGKTD